MKKIFKSKTTYLVIFLLFSFCFLGPEKVLGFVFGSESNVVQWIRENTIIRLRTETDDVRIGSSNTLFVDTSENKLGVGTNAPSSTLSVIGNSFISGVSTTTAQYISGLTTNYLPYASTSGLMANSGLYWDNTNNRLGINMINPLHTLDIQGSINTSGNLTADTDSLFVDSTNNMVGIGTTSPAYKLDVQDPSGPMLRIKRTAVFDSVQYWLSLASGSSLAGWTDITNEAGTTRGTVSGDILNVAGDYIYFGKTTPFSSIYIDIATAKSASGSSTFQYSTNNGVTTTWTTLTPVVDGTNNLINDGDITFTPPVDWTAEQVVGTTTNTLYWVRIGHTGATFGTEPTIYLAVPMVMSEPIAIYGNGNDVTPAIAIQENGYLNLNFVQTFSSIGSISMAGGLSGATTGGFSSAITQSSASTLYTHTVGLTLQGASAATANIPFQNSSVINFSSEAWNGSASMTNSLGMYLQPSATTTTDSRLVWKNTIVNDVANSGELMSLSSNGTLEVIGATFGEELFTDDLLDTGLTNWEVTGGWTYTTNDFTFVYATGASGTLKQTSDKFDPPLKPNTWYRFSRVNGVAAPATTLNWIGTEVAEENTYFSGLVGGPDVYFKTNSSPGDFVIYTTATATSNYRIDSMSLKEVSGGNIMTNGLFTGGGTSGIKIDNIGNVGVGVMAPTATLHLKDGTATANTAPLKFTSGTLLGIPEDGAVEYDGTNFYLTASTTRRTITTSVGGSANKASCWKTDGSLGYCSDVVGADGSCTCN